MTAENRNRLEALPTFLQPRLRLFLSADLVGSTASKQRPNFPIQEPKKLWADGSMAPPWLSPIANFFSSFREAFIREWKTFKSQTAPQLGINIRVDPSFWKANGDELIFVKELDDRKEILGCINAWIHALKVIRPHLQANGLDVKATAWTAGFPVTNSELVFEVNPGSRDVPFEGDSRLQQFALSETWHEGPGSQHSLIMDFIGPSIDIGFRLAAQSTSRRFVISIDIAYFLATAHLPPKNIIRVPPILYGSRTELKGVLGGKPYPIFWIDTMAGEGQPHAEDRLLGVTQLYDIKDFCLEFYQENSSLMFEPFIFREDEKQYGEFPINYIEALEHLRFTWEAEKTRYSGQTAIVSAADDESEKLSEAEAIDKEKAIISAIESQSSQNNPSPNMRNDLE